MVRRWTSALAVWWRRRTGVSDAPVEIDEIGDARRLIAAIDRGGLPLNPARVSAIARRLGLEVARHAPVEQTIGRIRACLQRADAQPYGCDRCDAD